MLEETEVIFEAAEFTDRKGAPYIIRSLVPDDAAALTRFVEQAQEKTYETERRIYADA